MGVTGLLEKLKGATQKAHISEFRGKRVAVDGYCWLHRGAISCSKELAHGNPTSRYIAFFLNMIKMLRSEGVDAILVVFDGLPLPGKEGTNSRRSADRFAQKQLALAAENAGDDKKARSHFQRSVSITFDMVQDLVEALEGAGVHYMVSPYEADAQLAFLSMNNVVDLVITEDSDAITYGCANVLYKLDREGNGDLIQREHLPLNQPMSFTNWTNDQFLLLCCLAGCDYLPGLRNFGIKSAYKVVSVNKTLSRVLDALSLHPAMQGSDRADFAAQLQRALLIYKHQTVYNPYTQSTEPLTPFPPHYSALAAGTSAVASTLVGGHVRSAVSRDNLADSTSEQELSFLGPQLSADITALLVTAKLDPRSLVPSVATEETGPHPSTPLCVPLTVTAVGSESADPEPAGPDMTHDQWHTGAARPTAMASSAPALPARARVVWTSPGDTELLATGLGDGSRSTAGFDTPARPRKRGRTKPTAVSAAAGITTTTRGAPVGTSGCNSRAAANHVTQFFHSDLVSEQLEPLHRRVRPRVGYLQLPRATTGATGGQATSSDDWDEQQRADGTAPSDGVMVDTFWDSDQGYGAVGAAYQGWKGQGGFFNLQEPPSPVALEEPGMVCEDSAGGYDTGSYVDDSFHDTVNTTGALNTEQGHRQGLALFQDEVFYPRFEQKLAVFGHTPLYDGRPVTVQSSPLPNWTVPSNGLARFCSENGPTEPLLVQSPVRSLAVDVLEPLQTAWPTRQHVLSTDWVEPAVAAWRPEMQLSHSQYPSQVGTLKPEWWSSMLSPCY